jgi:hypothetical protein
MLHDAAARCGFCTAAATALQLNLEQRSTHCYGFVGALLASHQQRPVSLNYRNRVFFWSMCVCALVYLVTYFLVGNRPIQDNRHRAQKNATKTVFGTVRCDEKVCVGESWELCHNPQKQKLRRGTHHSFAVNLSLKSTSFFRERGGDPQRFTKTRTNADRIFRRRIFRNPSSVPTSKFQIKTSRESSTVPRSLSRSTRHTRLPSTGGR